MSDPSNTTTKASVWRLERALHQGGREHQEDAVAVWSNRDATGIFVVVADGAGGHGGGAEASAAAVAEADRRWKEDGGAGDAGRFLEEWMLGAHDAVRGTGKGGSRTAAVAMLAAEGRVEWVHAGDCRLYHFRGGERLSRTRDDSVVQILFEQGEINEEEMGRHEDQNRLLQAIGGEDPPKPRKGSAAAQPGDVFLLCSDGFWENLEAEELARLTQAPAKKRGRALRQAMKIAVDRGGSKADNASAVLAAFGEDGDGARSGASPLAWRRGAWWFGAAALLAIVVLGLWNLRPSLAQWLDGIGIGGVEVVEAVGEGGSSASPEEAAPEPLNPAPDEP